MSSASWTAATLDDLHRVEGKAELVGGRIVHLTPTGFRPGRIGGRIYRSLDDHAATAGRGVALPDDVAYIVPELASGRRSFSPDASYHLGPIPLDAMEFLEGPPALAVEVRSRGDYGAAAEAAMSAKRDDDFEAGAEVVRDVDPKAETVAVYRAASPGRPTVFRRGQEADAEPAVPGWRLDLDGLFA